MSKNEKIFKIAIVCNKGVGKTSFLSICNPSKHHKEDCFVIPKKLGQTDFKIKIFKINNKDDEKRNNSILSESFCVILMFDMSQRNNFVSLLEWIIYIVDTVKFEGYVYVLGNYPENKKFLCTTQDEVKTFLKLKTQKADFYEIGNKNKEQKLNLIDSLIKKTAADYEKYMKDKKNCSIF